MSKAIGKLMKTSCLKCGKSEGSSRDVNLVFQSDWLSGATCLNQSHSEVIYQTQTVPGLHRFSDFVHGCSKTKPKLQLFFFF